MKEATLELGNKPDRYYQRESSDNISVLPLLPAVLEEPGLMQSKTGFIPPAWKTIWLPI